jgi:hypothetical protein
MLDVLKALSLFPAKAFMALLNFIPTKAVVFNNPIRQGIIPPELRDAYPVSKRRVKLGMLIIAYQRGAVIKARDNKTMETRTGMWITDHADIVKKWSF